jgi:DNA-binding transcriptional regulator GbsR (MarR family)
MKVWSDKQFTYIEDERGIIYFETGKCIDGSEIARILNTSRQNVSKTLKKSFKKIYLRIRNSNKGIKPFEIATLMAEMFGIETNKEFNSFYRLFPYEIKNKILEDSIGKGYNKALH